MGSFGRAPLHLSPLPWGANSELLAENLDFARGPPRLEDSESRVEPRALRWSSCQNRKERCLFLLACLLHCLLACCLLAPFKWRGM